MPQGLCREISRQTSADREHLDAGKIVGKLNAKIRGWANYFCLGPVGKAYRAIESHARKTLRQWLVRKHKVGGLGTARWPDEHL